MPSDLPLHPDVRDLYAASLRPPPGFVFDAGVATTFSLDLETALAVPVALALFSSENTEELLKSPLALLEGLERTAERLAIFCEGGRIQAQPAPQSRLCTLLERLITEVAAPRGGSFHPKLWALRYRPREAGKLVRMRLLVLSRNLTRDRSWDISLCLDGEIGRRMRTVNWPLVNLLQAIPSMARGAPPPKHLPELLAGLTEDLHRTVWELPDPFEKISFAVNGIGRSPWKPQRCYRLGIVSPFCDTAALETLADLADQPSRLIGRSEELVAVAREVLDRFEGVFVMDELAETEAGETDDSGNGTSPYLTGLHAKAFVQEIGWNTAITIGSGNATRPGLVTRRNVEVFATLTGKRSKVGSVDKIFGPDGFGRVLRPFRQAEISPIDQDILNAERRVEDARRELAQADLALSCTAVTDEQEGQRLWRVTLSSNRALKLEGLATAACWPVTRGEAHARELLTPLRQGDPVEIGTLPLGDVTRFLAFRLTDSLHRKATALFALGFRIEGLPTNRHQAVLRHVLDSREAFLRYLRLLLADLADPLSAQFASAPTDGAGNWRAAADDEPILEDMVRALSHGRDRLDSVRRLMERLEQVPGDGDVALVPEDFRELWDAFRMVLDEQGQTNA